MFSVIKDTTTEIVTFPNKTVKGFWKLNLTRDIVIWVHWKFNKSVMEGNVEAQKESIYTELVDSCLESITNLLECRLMKRISYQVKDT
jgi:hypothetical protein